ncbi:MAG: methylated-DNA--[protein]-cysteine S-methyltransferase [Candidatus Azobacteroides sp.]|nr:methylated-DNA--[protein]-cysteine S-methyltransferase [Candidatus Azobacteroides sp.]
MLYTHYISSPVGTLEITSDDTSVCRLVPVENAGKNTGSDKIPEVMQQCVKELNEYFSGKLKKFTVPVCQKGTTYQQKIWNELQKIPYGTTISYARLAEKTDHPKAYRAAGTANGKNKIIIIIPCHRVINSDGKSGGYAFGPEMKQFLLDLEKKYQS